MFYKAGLKAKFFCQNTASPNFRKLFPFVIFLFYIMLVSLSFMQHIKVTRRYKPHSAGGFTSTLWVIALLLERAFILMIEKPMQICCTICHVFLPDNCLLFSMWFLILKDLTQLTIVLNQSLSENFSHEGQYLLTLFSNQDWKMCLKMKCYYHDSHLCSRVCS